VSPNASTQKTNAAFSLLEVMCAVLILGVAMAGLTQGVTLALANCKESEVQTIAANAAAGVIEGLRAEKILSDGETDGDHRQGGRHPDHFPIERTKLGSFPIRKHCRHRDGRFYHQNFTDLQI